MNSAEELARFKSSYSGGSGGDRLEVAYDWKKSTYSSGKSGECVEISTCLCESHEVHIRDSKNPHVPHLTVTPAAWSHFLTHTAR